MSDTQRFNSAEAGRPVGGAPKGEDLLPPVEPPSARFIVQLFVIPALIVLVIFGVSLTFTWLVRRTASQPAEVIRGLEQGPAVARWQRASELADMLRNDRFEDFRRSGESAAELARILDREIDGGGMSDGEVAMRVYLSKALGKFEVNDGIDVLLKAARTSRDPAEQLVRYRAIEAIAERAYNLSQLEPPQVLTHPQLEETLLDLAGNENPYIRGRTVYALGQLGTPASIERLEVMTDDPDADTRYDAAIALAHRGNDKGAATLAEMLDLDELATIKSADPQDAPGDGSKRGVIVASAIEAAKKLATENPQANLEPVRGALETLEKADETDFRRAQVPPRAAFDARQALEFIGERMKGAKSPDE